MASKDQQMIERKQLQETARAMLSVPGADKIIDLWLRSYVNNLTWSTEDTHKTAFQQGARHVILNFLQLAEVTTTFDFRPLAERRKD